MKLYKIIAQICLIAIIGIIDGPKYLHADEDFGVPKSGVVQNLYWILSGHDVNKYAGFGICTVTNGEVIYIPFNPEYLCQIELYDTNGNAMAKTRMGKKYGINYSQAKKWYTKISEQDRKEMHFEKTSSVLTPQIGIASWRLFKISDCFEIKKPGDYTLEIKLQVYKRLILGKDIVFKLIKFPSVKINVRKGI